MTNNLIVNAGRTVGLLAALLVAGCGTSEEPEGGGERLRHCSRLEGRRCLPEEVLLRKGVCYSGYRQGQDPRQRIYPSHAEILEDLQLLIRGGWTFIRLFDTDIHGETVLEVIRENDLDLKVQLGVWISGKKEIHDASNQRDITNGIRLANKFDDIVIAVSVGNEVLSDWSSVLTPPDDLAEYIQQIRTEVPQPVTTDEMFPPFQMRDQYEDVIKVVEIVDYLSVHIYPFLEARWSWPEWKMSDVPEGPERAEAMADSALEFTKAALRNVRAALDERRLDLPLIIGEIGWKSRQTDMTEEAMENFRAHPVNQKLFYDRLEDWVFGEGQDEDSPSASLYFEAFDEPWKGADDGWGLFDVERRAKYVIWEDFPDLKPDDAPKYSLDDAVYFGKEDAAPTSDE